MHEKFKRLEISSQNPVCRVKDEFRFPYSYAEYDSEFLLESGVIIYHAAYNLYVKLESKKEHDYNDLLQRMSGPDMPPCNYYEIFNLDTGESAIVCA